MRFERLDNFIIEKVANDYVATLQSGDFVILNEVAYQALQSVNSSSDAHMAIQKILAQTNPAISAAHARAQASRTLQLMLKYGLIKPLKTENLQPTRRTALASLFTLGTFLAATSTANADESSELLASCSHPDSETWVDSLGNTVILPTKINRAAPFGPYAQAMLEAFQEEALAATITLRGLQASIDTQIDSTESIDSLTYGIDACITQNSLPDVIIDIATSVEHAATNIDSYATQLGIPVIHLIAGIDELSQAFTTLGEVLNRQNRAYELSCACTQLRMLIRTIASNVAQDEQKSGFYGTGELGLCTRNNETLLHEVFDMVGISNVAARLDQSECENIDAQQILEWEPDIAILDLEDLSESDNNLAQVVWSEGILQTIGRVALTPSLPVNWLGRSPFHIQTIGALWLVCLFYPEYCCFDEVTAIQEFWHFFYDIELSADDIEQLLDAKIDKSLQIQDNVGTEIQSAEELPIAQITLITTASLDATHAILISGGGDNSISTGINTAGTTSNPYILTLGTTSEFTLTAGTNWIMCSEVQGAIDWAIQASGAGQIDVYLNIPYGEWISSKDSGLSTNSYIPSSATNTYWFKITSSGPVTALCSISLHTYEKASTHPLGEARAPKNSLIRPGAYPRGLKKIYLTQAGASAYLEFISSELWNEFIEEVYEELLEDEYETAVKTAFDALIQLCSKTSIEFANGAFVALQNAEYLMTAGKLLETLTLSSVITNVSERIRDCQSGNENLGICLNFWYSPNYSNEIDGVTCHEWEVTMPMCNEPGYDNGRFCSVNDIIDGTYW